jgi:hypothetical protein
LTRSCPGGILAAPGLEEGKSGSHLAAPRPLARICNVAEKSFLRDALLPFALEIMANPTCAIQSYAFHIEAHS